MTDDRDLSWRAFADELEAALFEDETNRAELDPCDGRHITFGCSAAP